MLNDIQQQPVDTAAAVKWSWTGAFGWMTLSADDVLEIGFVPGTLLSAQVTEEMHRQYKSRFKEPDVHLIVDISGVDGVAAGVPKQFSAMIPRARVAILGEGPADRVLARFFMRKLSPGHNCSYFENIDKAREHVLSYA